MRSIFGASGFNVAATLELRKAPPLDRRGDEPRMLQCGRNFRVAEGPGGALVENSDDLLQCGRNFRVAEGALATQARAPALIASMWPQL